MKAELRSFHWEVQEGFAGEIVTFAVVLSMKG